MYITPEEVQEEEEEKKKKTLAGRALGEALFQASSVAAAANLLPMAASLPIKAVDKWGTRDPELVRVMAHEAARRGLIDSMWLHRDPNVLNAFFRAGDKSVHVFDKTKDLGGIVAHELGHAQSYKDTLDSGRTLQQYATAYSIGDLGPLAGTVINTVGHNYLTTPQMLGIAAASALPVLPRIIEELKASKNGYKIMRENGRGIGESLTTFSGVPTYLASAAMPFVPALVAKLFGRTADKKKKKKDKDKEKEKE